MLMTKIMGFLHSKGKRKVIRSSSIRFCWLFLCKILSYVSMFTIQKREFLLFNFLFSIDCKHKQMGRFFFLSWSFISRHCADPGWKSEFTEPCSHQTGWALCPPERLNPEGSALTQFVPRLADVTRLEDLPFNSEGFFVPNCVACDDSIITCVNILLELQKSVQKQDAWCYTVSHLCWTICFCLEEIVSAVQRYHGKLHVFFKGDCILG